ncbi:hypothetical protein ACEPAG_3493 [Sanghuangporus baumii]
MHCPLRLVLYILATLILYAQVIYSKSVQPVQRGATTDAICRPEFDWMNNSKHQSPCLIAAYLLAPCQVTDDGDVHAINDSYLAPTAENADACWCSWGVYNTLEACAACQSNKTYLLSWYNYLTNCSTDLQPNTEFYPSNNTIAEETAVPFWATINHKQNAFLVAEDQISHYMILCLISASTWDSGTVNVTQAQAIAGEGKEDITH